MPSPIKSEAQLNMFTRAAADPVYAAQRGITQETALKALADHKEAGSPPVVPGHLVGGGNKEKGATPRIKKPKRPPYGGLFGARHR